MRFEALKVKRPELNFYMKFTARANRMKRRGGAGRKRQRDE